MSQFFQRTEFKMFFLLLSEFKSKLKLCQAISGLDNFSQGNRF